MSQPERRCERCRGRLGHEQRVSLEPCHTLDADDDEWIEYARCLSCGLMSVAAPWAGWPFWDPNLGVHIYNIRTQAMDWFIDGELIEGGAQRMPRLDGFDRLRPLWPVPMHKRKRARAKPWPTT